MRFLDAARRGATLLELLLVLAIVAVLAAIAAPSLARGAARRAASAAALDVALLLARGRHLAATSLSGAAVAFDTANARVTLRVGGHRARHLDLRALHGVRLEASRDSLAYDSRGIGSGAANVTIIVAAGAAAETLVVSRLGRLRGAR